MKGYKLSSSVKLFFETPSSDISEWFGYYNCDALNTDHTRMLCTRVKEDGVVPRADLKVEVGYYDIPSGVWHYVGESDSWNWQQGAMLQWLNDDEIIYNSSEDSQHIAIIHNLKTCKKRKINWAIYGIMPDGKKSLSLDMERAHWCRAYHYQSVVCKSKDGKIYSDDGVFEVDLQNNTRRRIISIQEILALDSRPYFDKAKHWLEHIMINQDGSKFCFLHRFSSVTNIYSYKTRLIIVDTKTFKMECVPGWENTQWSHFGWNRDDFVIYAYPTRKKVNEKNFEVGNVIQTIPPQLQQEQLTIKSVLKKVIRTLLPIRILLKLKGGLTGYQYYKTSDKGYTLIENINSTPFLIDGHPSFTPDCRYLITDTYPNRKHYQKLYIYDLKTKKHLLLGTFYAFYDKNPASCDLHPKLSRDGNYVVVDSAHDNKHHMIVLKLNWDFIKKRISK